MAESVSEAANCLCTPELSSCTCLPPMWILHMHYLQYKAMQDLQMAYALHSCIVTVAVPALALNLCVLLRRSAELQQHIDDLYQDAFDPTTSCDRSATKAHTTAVSSAAC